jgi:hypothetical protein
MEQPTAHFEICSIMCVAELRPEEVADIQVLVSGHEIPLSALHRGHKAQNKTNQQEAIPQMKNTPIQRHDRTESIEDNE